MTDLAMIDITALPDGRIRLVIFDDKSVVDERTGTFSMMMREVERLSKRLKTPKADRRFLMREAG